jgi:hypothetical protein
MSANAATDSNTNPIGLNANTNVVVSSLTLTIPRGTTHTVFLIGHFSADTVAAVGGEVVAGILVDGNLMMDTQVNNVQGAAGPLLSLSGVLSLKGGRHKFELQAYVANMNSASVHHRSLTAIDLG